MVKRQGFCIFCGGTQKSKEHIWPDWLRPYIPRTHTHTKHTIDRKLIHRVNGKSDQVSYEGKLHRQGDPRSQKLREVCRTCNNGWMSKLQNDSKDVLIPLLRGDWESVSVTAQKKLAAWACMFTMVYEWADSGTVAVSDEERKLFKSNSEAPSHWRIWMGKYCGNKNIERTFTAKHTGLGLASSSMEITGKFPCDTQITTFVLGKILFQAFSTTFVNFAKLGETEWNELDDYYKQLGMIHIWPPPTSIIWNSEKELSYEEAMHVVYYLRGSLIEALT